MRKSDIFLSVVPSKGIGSSVATGRTYASEDATASLLSEVVTARSGPSAALVFFPLRVPPVPPANEHGQQRADALAAVRSMTQLGQVSG